MMFAGVWLLRKPQYSFLSSLKAYIFFQSLTIVWTLPNIRASK